MVLAGPIMTIPVLIEVLWRGIIYHVCITLLDMNHIQPAWFQAVLFCLLQAIPWPGQQAGHLIVVSLLAPGIFIGSYTLCRLRGIYGNVAVPLCCHVTTAIAIICWYALS